MRGPGYPARLVAVAVVVLSALTLVALAARSGRTETVTPTSTGSPVATPEPGDGTMTAQRKRDGGEQDRGADTSGGEMADELVWIVIGILVLLVLLGAVFVRQVFRPRLQRGRQLPAPDGDPALPPDPDEVEADRLATAVEEGLRGLEWGGPGEGVVACWVQLERVAADAGTHREAPDTPSELAGRLIDRHDVSSGPLLRLAELYREARFSTHQLPESARAEARAAMEQLRAELESSPVTGRRR